MIKRNALIGLEENGGFMYGELNQVRDGAMTTALVLDMLANFSAAANKSTTTTTQFSEIIGSLKNIAQFKTKFKCSSKEVANKIVTKCLEHGSPKKIEKLDGAKIWIDDESWIMVRPSGTEPLVRMYGESISQTLLDSKVREYTRIIESVLQ
jgi:phosphomannomutase/phosphoglucomutase